MILTRSFILVLAALMSSTCSIGFVSDDVPMKRTCRIKSHISKLKRKMRSGFPKLKKKKKIRFRKSCSPFKFNVNDYKMMSDAFIEAYEMLQVKYEKEVEEHRRTREELRLAIKDKRESEKSLEMLKTEVTDLANKWELQINEHKMNFQCEIQELGKKLEICEKSLAVWKHKKSGSEICFAKKHKPRRNKNRCKKKSCNAKSKSKYKSSNVDIRGFIDGEDISIGMAAPM